MEEQTKFLKSKAEDFLNLLSFDGKVVVANQDGAFFVNISLADPALLIGERGETLPALQHLIRLFVSKSDLLPFGSRIIVDVNEYKSKRISGIEKKAEEWISRVRITGLPEVLPPMNSFERKSVHELVAKTDDLESFSSGEGEDRRVAIQLKK